MLFGLSRFLAENLKFFETKKLHSCASHQVETQNFKHYAHMHAYALLELLTLIDYHATENKTIGDEGINLDFWIIKVHTSS